MRIDFHTHAFPDALAQRAIEKLSKVSGNLPYHTDGTHSGLAAAAKAAGIDTYVILNIAVKPHQMRTVNDSAAQQEKGAAIQFASIHPLAEDAIDEVRRVRGMGFQGVKMHPEYQHFAVDDPRTFPVYQALADNGLISVFHAGYDLGFGTAPNCAPHMLKKALPYFEGAPVVAAHMGGLSDWLNVEKYLVGSPGLYFDTSFSFTHIPPEAARNIIVNHGADKVLFGSDSPWSNISNEINFLESLNLPPADTAAILGLNAKRLLGL